MNIGKALKASMVAGALAVNVGQAQAITNNVIELNKRLVQVTNPSYQWHAEQKGQGQPQIYLIGDHHELLRYGKEWAELTKIIELLKKEGVTTVGLESVAAGNKGLTNCVMSEIGLNNALDAAFLAKDGRKHTLLSLDEAFQLQPFYHTFTTNGITPYGVDVPALFTKQGYLIYMTQLASQLSAENPTRAYQQINALESLLNNESGIPFLTASNVQRERGTLMKKITPLFNKYTLLRSQAGVTNVLAMYRETGKPTAVIYGNGHLSQISEELSRQAVPHAVIESKVVRQIVTSLENIRKTLAQ